MTNLTGSERAHYVQDMFTRIASHYDLMNKLMTAGQDVRWRKEVIRRAKLPPDALLLDLGAGTGDLGREALNWAEGIRSVEADFTMQMMLVGQARPASAVNESRRLFWSAADATSLPFKDRCFDALVSGFLLRNVSTLRLALQEQFRVLKPGGRFVALDTSPPPNNLLAPFVRVHLHTIIPALGRIIAGDSAAYTYLPESTEGFLAPEILAARLIEAGFRKVGFSRLMFGTIAIYWGEKPSDAS
jgi:demethylmenaquinone methyltransferase/2-methoxy-6-polyprenyl-1,4-benzoquinol methylase